MSKKIIVFIALVGILTTTTACSNQEATASMASGHEFTYDEQQAWEFESGEMQSPIDIQTGTTEEVSTDWSHGITTNYQKQVATIEDNGHTIKVADSGQAVIENRLFELQQVHFHAESEHTVNGEHYPLEAHFVHEAEDGRIAVIAVFFEVGEANTEFAKILAGVTQGQTAEVIDLTELLPTNDSYYHYLGSLTTPPLTENVEWYIMQQPLTVSQEQMAEFQTYYDENNREVQPLNEREVLTYTH